MKLNKASLQKILTLILLHYKLTRKTKTRDERARERCERVYRSLAEWKTQNGTTMSAEQRRTTQNKGREMRSAQAVRPRIDTHTHTHTMNRSRLNIFVISSILNIAR